MIDDYGKQAEALLAALKEHPLRRELAAEVHARPYEQLHPPLQVSHLALISGETGGQAEREHVAALCERFGAESPGSSSNHHSVDLGGWRLKWERHTEFSTYSFYQEGHFEQPFAHPPIERVPRDWLESLPGQTLVGTHIALFSATTPQPDLDQVSQLFERNTVAGSTVVGGAARVWSDFRLHEDGFGRLLICDLGLRSRQAGRLVQRLLEIETYRMMALLAFPVARGLGAELADLDRQLTAVVSQLPELDDHQSEQKMLSQLTRMAARIERLAQHNGYRFAASAAYFELVRSRIEDIREQRIQGLQTFEEFMHRRLTPAMRTVESVQARIQSLSNRVARPSELLRTRVDIELEAQNHRLLASMDRRAKLQLRLQETVEGLSVVVLSYYSVSLLGYAFKAAKQAGVLPIDATLATGLSIPLVIGGVFWGLSRMRKRLMHED